jgi:long-chain fatty acid transport protein
MSKRYNSHPAIASLAFASVALVTAGVVNASGFALVEQSVKQVGSAISGGAASAEDASTIFFNPAGMTRLQGDELTLGAHDIIPSAKYSGDATTAFDTPISGGNGGDAGGGVPVPALFYAHELDNQLMLGLGISAPFGLKTEYDDGWEGRYHATKSEVKTVNINPSIAYKVNEQLSLGAGINYMRASATLSNAVDYSTACIGGALDAGAPDVATAISACSPYGLATPGNAATDGSVTVKGNDWAYGYNLGLLYELNPETRIGVAYRSSIKQKLTGTADFTAPNATADAVLGAVLADTGATAKVTLPASLSLSMSTLVAPQWELMADLTWTGWSSFDELRVKFDNPLKADSVQNENWRDTYKLSVGFNYRHNAQWTWRGGVAYDQTPIRNTKDRTPRIPGNSRTWLAAGTSYQVSPAMTLDFALAHLFVSNTDINATDSSFGHLLSGSYDPSVNIVSAGLVWQF